jgi:PPOX class probable F420-dependent enzyme
MSLINDSIQEFLDGRHYASLATQNDDGSMHLTPVWYLFEDGKFFISTNTFGRKFNNILARHQVSLMVDSRRTQGEEMWVSVSGKAGIIEGDESKEINTKIVKRYLTKAAMEDPDIGQVFVASDKATISLRPETVQSWKLQDLDDIYFGGKLRQKPNKWFLPVE